MANFKTSIGGGARLDMWSAYSDAVGTSEDPLASAVLTIDGITGTQRTGDMGYDEAMVLDITNFTNSEAFKLFLAEHEIKLVENDISLSNEAGALEEIKSAEGSFADNANKAKLINFAYYYATNRNETGVDIMYGQGYFTGNTGDRGTAENTAATVPFQITTIKPTVVVDFADAGSPAIDGTVTAYKTMATPTTIPLTGTGAYGVVGKLV